MYETCNGITSFLKPCVINALAADLSYMFICYSPYRESVCMQVKADVYDEIDKELLGYVEDVLLNRRENATERMLEYAALLDPKSKPTAVKKLADEAEPPLNPAQTESNPARREPRCVPDLPPVPEYQEYRCVLQQR